MNNLVLKAIVLVALPIVVFTAGAFLILNLSGYKDVGKQLCAEEDAKPLYLRLAGYDLDDVSRHWSLLDDRSHAIEQRFLKMDLVFPVFYGAALAVSLLLCSATLGRPLHHLWLLTPIAVTVLADWTENLVQMQQLQRYAQSGEAGLQTGWIQLSSAATIIKLVSFGLSLLLVFVAGWMLWCKRAR